MSVVEVVVRRFEQADLPIIKSLFTAYHVSLPIDISYQNYQDEFNQLPGKYVESRGGALFIAERRQGNSVTKREEGEEERGGGGGEAGGEVLGCVALRKMDDATCELKRLYVLPQARGLRVGFELVNAVIKEADSQGYSRILLDTLPTMKSALSLYARVGFLQVPKYYESPIEETVFLEKKLK